MENLSNDILVDAYIKAIELDFQVDFIQILSDEIDKRNLTRLARLNQQERETTPMY